MTDLRTGSQARTGCEGIALLITVILLLMLSAIGLTALNRAGDESNMSGSSQRKTFALSAAEAGVALVTDQLVNAQQVSGAVLGGGGVLLNPTAPINEPTLIKDTQGYFTQIRTGTVDSAVPLPIERKDSRTPEGYELNEGEKPWVWRIYRATVVASDTAGGVAQIQTQYKVREETSYQ